MPKSPFHIAVDEGCKATVTPTTAIAQGLAVGFDGQIIGTLGAVAYGIAKFDGIAGQALTIVTSNEAVVRLGATVSAVGAELTINAAGKSVPAVSGNYVYARALQTGAADDYVRVLFSREGVKA